MEIKKILDELYNLSVFGMKLGLENIYEIMNRLGNPQNSYKTIHIAGTNGKGSTATMLEAALIESGYKVGKYTSPHIIKFNERIVVNNQEISDEDIVKYYLKVKSILKEIPATFFEVTTAMMFLYFKDREIDYGVIEVGLGGRFDATNIITPICSIITSISLDHINILGNNLFEIAREKAGIIKKDIPCFVSDTKEDIKVPCEERNGNIIYPKEKYEYEILLDREKLETQVLLEGEEYRLSLFGEFQGINFLNVYACLKYLNVENYIIKRAMKKLKWPGRFEIISKDPLVILDGAHNEDSAKKLLENLKGLIKREDTSLIVSILEDKEFTKIIKIFNEISDKIIFTSLREYHRGLSGEELYKKAKNINNSTYYEDLKEAYKEARKSKNVVVAGSFYLLSKFKEVSKSE